MRETEVGSRCSIINIISIFQGKKFRRGKIRAQVTQLINSRALHLFLLSPKPGTFLSHHTGPQQFFWLVGFLGVSILNNSVPSHRWPTFGICPLTFFFPFFFKTMHCVTQSALEKKNVLFDKSIEHPGSAVDAALFQCILNGK